MWTAIIFFCILAITFQVVAYRTYTQEALWLLTDYFWLLIAATALIFYASKAEQYEASRMLPTGIKYNQESDELSSIRLSNSILHLEITEQEAKEITNNTQKIDSIELNKRVQAALEKIDKVGWQQFLKTEYSHGAMSYGLTSPAVLKELDKIDLDFAEVSKRHAELKELRNKAQGSNWNAVELILYPFLVAFALAVRLGRTTADYLRKTRQAQAQVCATPDLRDTKEASAQ